MIPYIIHNSFYRLNINDTLKEAQKWKGNCRKMPVYNHENIKMVLNYINQK